MRQQRKRQQQPKRRCRKVLRTATAEAESDLLGENWTGSGTYTLVGACKAYNAEDDFTAYAARITAPGFEDGVTLFWRMNGEALGDGLLTGDTVTREFSAWGELSNTGSPIDEAVNEAKASDEGEAAIECAER